MTTVYIVTNGEYSDYQIVAAFSTRENAEKFIACRMPENGYFDGSYQINEFTLDETQVETEDKIVYVYAVFHYGWHNNICIEDRFWIFKSKLGEFKRKWEKDRTWHGGWEQIVVLDEPNEEKARKIYADRIAKKKAEYEWLT